MKYFYYNGFTCVANDFFNIHVGIYKSSKGLFSIKKIATKLKEPDLTITSFQEISKKQYDLFNKEFN